MYTKSTSPRLERESKTLKLFLAVFVLLIASGYATYFSTNSNGSWRYFNMLGHLGLGILFLYPLIKYTLAHAIRVLGLRRPLSLTLGFMTTIGLIVLVITGLYLILRGQAETTSWVFDSHIVAAHSVIGLTIVHTIIALFRKTPGYGYRFEKFKSLGIRHFIWLGTTLGVYLIMLFSISLLYQHSLKVNDKSISADGYEYRYGDHPFLPSQTETPNLDFIDHDKIAVSRSCGTCHEEIYKQWSASAHRQAASDPTYVKNINLLADNQGISATRYCEGCHAPVALLTGQLTPGGNHGGASGTAAFHEGVGCLGCHNIEKAVHLNGTASYLFTPSDTYLYEGAQSGLGKKIYNLLIRIHPAEHKNAMRKDILGQPELCATCHEQFMDKTMNNWGWVKLQNVYSDWLSSPYSGQTEQSFQDTNTKRCQDCHFPLEKAADPSADVNGQIRAHWAPGANTMLPHLNGDLDHLNRITQFLQNNKVNVSIDPPSRNDAIQTGQIVNQALRPDASDNTPYFLYLGETAKLRITVTNRGVGHSFPTGTLDINESWLHFRVSDASGDVIYESGSLNQQKFVDQSAHFYHSNPVDRQGKSVWKHDLFRMTGETYRNVIPAGKSDIVDYQFEIPFWTKSPITISATLRYRKLNRRYANWALGSDHPDLPIVNLSSDTETISILVQRAIGE